MDVDYRDAYAVAAGILFNAWESDATLKELTVRIETVAPYEPGRFYKRELPCLISLIKKLERLPALFIVDSFVTLDANNRPGLGAYLYDHFQQEIPVIGVAKKRFKGNSSAIEIMRGKSQTPLFITAAGVETRQAAKLIQTMHGKYRLPTLLKRVDQLCRRNS